MAATAGMADSAPVHALVSLGSADQAVAGVRRPDRGRESRRSIGVGAGLEPAAGHVALERLGLAAHAPALPTQVAKLAARPKPEFVAVALNHSLEPRGIRNTHSAAQ